MKRKWGRSYSARKWAAALLLFPLLSACASAGGGSGSESGAAAIDPPPASAEESMMAASQADIQSAVPVLQPSVIQEAPEHSVTVYLRDQQGYLAPMTLRLDQEDPSATESAQAAAETAMTWLTQSADRQGELPEGFVAVLPDSAKVNAVKLDSESGTAAIDFAAPMPDLPAAQERQMLEALVWTMTEIPGIDKVKLTAGGKPVRSLPASGLPAPEVLTRGVGINVEQTAGVQPSRTMGVTLYFSANSANGDGYFVPVTRLIERTDDRMQAAMNELIKGPAQSSSLQPVLMPGITVDKLAPQAGSVNISLLDEGWSPANPVPSAMMEAIVLTMTEVADTPSVKVAINGDDQFEDSDQRTYDRPVNRPVVVNMLKR